MRKSLGVLTFTAAFAASPLLVGCESLPGTRRQQATVGGAAGGAAAGALIDRDNRGRGAIIGGLLGAGGGYLIGGQLDKDEDSARLASDRAQANPATAQDVRDARTADLNNDGFVSLDEVVAMHEAGLSDRQMLERLRATGQVFALNADQERYLRDRGVSREVIEGMRDLNQNVVDDRVDPSAPIGR